MHTPDWFADFVLPILIPHWCDWLLDVLRKTNMRQSITHVQLKHEKGCWRAQAASDYRALARRLTEAKDGCNAQSGQFSSPMDASTLSWFLLFYLFDTTRMHERSVTFLLCKWTQTSLIASINYLDHGMAKCIPKLNLHMAASPPPKYPCKSFIYLFLTT